MKTALKVIAILVAVAGVVYIAATYGDRIVSWAKRMMSNLCWEDCCCDEAVEAYDADFQG
ncbi:MAG: hypothetical protein IKK11_05195 [Oscillospiraceae bacterium]|nr:hypothetical protein [Oscillospiraceae bacterium]